MSTKQPYHSQYHGFFIKRKTKTSCHFPAPILSFCKNPRGVRFLHFFSYIVIRPLLGDKRRESSVTDHFSIKKPCFQYILLALLLFSLGNVQAQSEDDYEYEYDHTYEYNHEYHYEWGMWGYRHEAKLIDSLSVLEMMDSLTRQEVAYQWEDFQEKKRKARKEKKEKKKKKEKDKKDKKKKKGDRKTEKGNRRTESGEGKEMGWAVPGVDAPGVDAPGVDAPGVDAPGVDAPGWAEDGASAPGVDAPVAPLDASLTAGLDYVAPLRVMKQAAMDMVPDAQERAALVAIYNQMNGQNWAYQDNWLQGTSIEDIATWLGVTVENGDVVALELRRNNLTGGLPNTIANLSALEYLNLGGNAITSLPQQIEGLTNLKGLYLDECQLANLPSGIGNLGKLETLYLNYNQLTSLPSTIEKLDALTAFYLYGNPLVTLPPQIGGLSSLTNLFLFQSSVTSLPDEIGQLKELRGLFPRETQLTRLPATINNLTNLRFLNVADSKLKALPVMDKLNNLRGVIVSGNRLEQIPNWSSHPNIANLFWFVEDNFIDLNQIAQNLTGPDTHPFVDFRYRPQSSPGEVLPVAGALLDPFPVKHPQSSYQWQRQVNGNWQDIAGATTPTYTGEQGSLYRCRLTNAWLPGMIYYSHPLQPDVSGATTQWIEAECASVGSRWQVKADAQASGGEYVVYPQGEGAYRTSPSTDPADQLVYTVSVEQAQSYYLLARISAPSYGDDSFWVKIDDKDWITWSGGIKVNQGFAWNQVPGGAVFLTKGTHTIIFTYREDGARLDKLSLSLSAELPSGQGEAALACESTGVAASHWVEAECAQVGSNWQQQESSSASAGKYVVYPSGNFVVGPSAKPEDHLVYSLEIGQAQSYFLMARVNAPSYSDDSFWVKIDDEEWFPWGSGIKVNRGFQWNLVPGGALALSAGSHTITLACREDGTQLDKLALRLTSALPTGLGEEAPECEETGPEPAPGEPLAFEGQWGGNVSAMVWSTFHYEQPVYQQVYTYQYDKVNRLLEARYASKDTEGGWTANESNYSVKGIGYDENGNILSLTRYSAEPEPESGTSTRQIMDELSYRYGTGNQVQSVMDEADAAIGFQDKASSSNEYGYDENGNLIRDDNKGITSIAYDPVLDLPLRVDFADGGRIDYVYDAAGNRLSQTITPASGEASTTDYFGGIQYKEGTLDFATHPEGRVKRKSDGSFVYHYDLSDHLGNTRLTFSEEPMTMNSMASMEMSAAPLEEALFQNLASSRQTLAYHNTTDASISEPVPNKVATLLPGEQGLGKSLSVRKGDAVHLQVNARYETAPAQAPGIEGVATEVAGAVQKTAAGLESSGAAAGLNGATITGALASGEEQGVPTAYLNYLLYDADYQLIDQGYVQVSEAAAVGKKNPEAAPEMLALDVDVKENGYLYAYLSHEATGGAVANSPAASANNIVPANGPVMNNGTPVHFDDFVVEHEGISIVQQDDYYAFGAPFRQQPKVGLKNKYLYQGKEWQSELSLALYDFHARQYDPLLGRMNSLDPMAASFDGMSPYVGMGNNPTMYVDPNGEVIQLGLALLGGAVIGGGAGYLYGRSQGYQGWDMGYAILGGAALGVGVAAGIHTGFFGKVGTGIGNALGQGAGTFDTGIGYAERVFQGVKPFADAGLAQVLPQATTYPNTISSAQIELSPGNWTDYNSYVRSQPPSPYEGMNAVERSMAQTSAGFWSHGATQLAIEVATAPLPVPKVGLAKLGRLAVKGFQKHHVIPNAVYKQFAQQLDNMKWYQNHGMNLKKLPTPFHGNHPAYNKYVSKQIDDLISQGKFDMKNMQQLQHRLRQQINRIYLDGNFQRLNHYYKNVAP